MKEFETPAIPLKDGLRPFKSVRNSSALDECFNLMPTEVGLESHETLTDLNADGVTWDGLGKLDRPMETDVVTLNVTSYVYLEILEDVTVTLDGVEIGDTDGDGNIALGTVTIGIHNLIITVVADVVYNDYIIVEPVKEVIVNVDDFITDGDIEGVKVLIDGVSFGLTSPAGNVTCWLRPGVHKLRLEGPGYIDGDLDQLINDYFTVT